MSHCRIVFDLDAPPKWIVWLCKLVHSIMCSILEKANYEVNLQNRYTTHMQINFYCHRYNKTLQLHTISPPMAAESCAYNFPWWMSLLHCLMAVYPLA